MHATTLTTQDYIDYAGHRDTRERGGERGDGAAGQKVTLRAPTACALSAEVVHLRSFSSSMCCMCTNRSCTCTSRSPAQVPCARVERNAIAWCFAGGGTADRRHLKLLRWRGSSCDQRRLHQLRSLAMVHRIHRIHKSSPARKFKTLSPVKLSSLR